MSIETTETTGQLSPTARRESFMGALSLAEHIMSETPVIPTSFDVIVSNWLCGETEIRFYFHRDPAALRQFAEERFMAVSTEDRKASGVYTEARGRVGDVTVIAWALSAAEVAQVAA
jgi:hypothetical protein